MVTLIREDGEDYIVTDGTTEARAPKKSLTNNLDILKGTIDGINQKRAKQDSIDEARRVQVEASKKEQASIASQRNLRPPPCSSVSSSSTASQAQSTFHQDASSVHAQPTNKKKLYYCKICGKVSSSSARETCRQSDPRYPSMCFKYPMDQ